MTANHGGEQGLTQVNDVELAWHRYGQGDPIVLLHGWTGSSRGWNGVVDDLARPREVVTVDHRGHGESTKTGDADSYTFDQLVDDFAAFVDAIGLDRFHLLGHSMGGLVAMRYALRYEPRVQSLLLVDTGAGAAPGSDALMQPVIDLVTAEGTAAYWAVLEGYLEVGEVEEQLRADLEWEIGHVDPVALVAFARELTTFPSVLDQLATLRVPTTVIVGENDVGLRAPADDLATTIPGARLEVIPGVGHVPQIENRTGWMAAVDRHFADVDERGGNGATV